MSDKFKCFSGIVMILFSLAIITIPHLCVKGSNEIRFRSGSETEWHISGISTERNGKVAVNTVDGEVLRTLPGIGEVLSSLIIREREEHGPYYYAEDLEAVKGIGPGILSRFRDLIDLAKGESGE